MLPCRELTELVDDFIDGRLSFWERAKFQMHVGMCTDCRDYLAQLRATRQALGSLPEPPMSDDVREELLERFRTWKRATPCSGSEPGGEPGPDGATET